MTYTPANYNVGFYGNSSVIFYSPKTDDHPTIVSADAVSSNFFYCNTFDLYPEYTASTGEHIRGFPDRTVFEVAPIKIEGNIQQKMLARMDGSPDYVMARLYEHCRHAWEGYSYTSSFDGSGVEGLGGSLFAPQFSLFSDVTGSFSECMVNSIELVAEANQQIVVNYGIVAKKLWTEDMPSIRNLMSSLATNTDSSTPMRQVYSTDCAIIVGNGYGGEPVNSAFALTGGGDSPFLQGYNFSDLPGNDKIIKMSLKIENFLEPNHTMQSRSRWPMRVERDKYIDQRVTENLWPRNYYPAKPRQISGEITWLTDNAPIDIIQRIAGAAGDQMLSYNGGIMGQAMLLYFGPIVIHLQNPIWSLSKPETQIDQLLKITAKFSGASDGELVLSPTKSWI